MDSSISVRTIPRSPRIPNDVEFSDEDSRYLNWFLGCVRGCASKYEWWGNVTHVLRRTDHQQRSRLVHHTLLVTAYFAAFRINWGVPWVLQPVGVEYELRLREFAENHDVAAYNSWGRHFDYSKRLVQEAIERGDYDDAMLGSLLLTMVTFWLGRFRECLYHGQVSRWCAMEVSQSTPDDTAELINEIEDWTGDAHFAVQQYPGY